MLSLAGRRGGDSLGAALQALVKELTCPICLCLLGEPVVKTPCGHLFCQDCIKRSLRPRTNDDSQDLAIRPKTTHWCPVCKAKCLPRALEPCEAIVGRLLEKVSAVLAAFQLDYGVSCSQYIPPKRPSMSAMASIPEADTDEGSDHWDEKAGARREEYREMTVEVNFPDTLTTQLGLPSTPEQLFVRPKAQRRADREDATVDHQDITASAVAHDKMLLSDIEPSIPSTLVDVPPTIEPPVIHEPAIDPALPLITEPSRKRPRKKRQQVLETLSPSPTIADRLVQRPLCLATSMLSKDDSATVERFCRQFRCLLSPQISSELTHLVVTPVALASPDSQRSHRSACVRSPRTPLTPPHGAIVDGSSTGRYSRRTFKYLQCRFLPSCHVVSIDWIQRCMQSGAIVEDTPFVVHGDSEFHGKGRSQPLASSGMGEMSQLFAAYNFYLYGEFVSPSRNDIAHLIGLGGGAVLAEASQLLARRRSLPTTLVLCDDRVQTTFERDADILRHHRPLLSARWLLDCVSAGELLDTLDYHVL